MGWSIGYDDDWKRSIGYGVIAYCDHPHCKEQIDRGLPYVCAGEEPHGGDGCGLYFCEKHHRHWKRDEHGFCYRCSRNKEPFKPKPEHPIWISWVRKDSSWAEWRRTREGKAFLAKYADVPSVEVSEDDF